MKKVLALLLSFIMIFSLCACGGQTEEAPAAPAAPALDVNAEAPAAPATETQN